MIVPARPEHAVEIASLHARMLGGLQSELGERICRLFYEITLAEPHSEFVFVYLDADRVRGFASASRDAARSFKRLVRKRPFALAIALLAMVLKHPTLAVRIPRQLLQDRHNRFCETQITAIAVDSEFRGQGIGLRLQKRLIQKCSDEGVGYIEISISLDNTGSMRIHEQLGFRKLRDFRSHGVSRRRLYYGVAPSTK